jgi:hypothetical protein
LSLGKTDDQVDRIFAWMAVEDLFEFQPIMGRYVLTRNMDEIWLIFWEFHSLQKGH